MKTYDELKTLIDQRGVHAVFGEPGEGWGIEQNSAELAEFLVEMQKLGVESVLEIGTGYKAGLARFLHDDMGWQALSIDVHDYGHQFGGITFMTDRRGVIGHYDLVLIDADHSYEGVKTDRAYYGQFAEMAIAFHDICGLRDCEGAKQYWDEIAYEGRDLKIGYHEIIAEGDQRGGIGYIVLAEVEAPAPEPVTPKAEAKKPAPRKPAAKTPAPKKAPVKK